MLLWEKHKKTQLNQLFRFKYVGDSKYQILSRVDNRGLNGVGPTV